MSYPYGVPPPNGPLDGGPSPYPGPPYRTTNTPPPTTPVPSSHSRPTSPPIQDNPAVRRTKRHYPTMPAADQSFPQPAAPHVPPPTFSPFQPPVAQPSVPTAHVPPATLKNPYDGMVNGLANLNLSAREDFSLMGQPPLIEDLNNPPPTPQLPPNLSVTPSVYAQCSSRYNRCTLNAVPFSNSLLKQSSLPFSLILEPYPTPATENEDVPVVQDTVVARCTRCKTYINPFVQLRENALQWRCNMCGLDNDVPSSFDWDVVNQQHVDRWSRPELNYGCVDFVASAEYMVRPPQPPVYVFVIDTSYQAVQTGMISIVTDAILAALDKIPNEDGRTKIAFITVDSAVAFYKLTGDEPEILVVGELNDMYLPRATSDLVVNLAESRSIIEDLLNRMKTMYNGTHAATNCLGPALQAARKLMSSTGGKIVCFQGSLPSVGEGAVKAQEDRSVPVTEAPLMPPSNSFFKLFANECSKSQVCADMFIFGNHYSDVATLNVIPRFTGGQTHFYPMFKSTNTADAIQVKEEIVALLGEKIGLEAVMRTRCSPGLVCKAFYGNCTTRVPDVMALPNVPRNQLYCVDIGIEEDIQSPVVFFQTALLYTTCFGERRIRVMNLCLPVTKNLGEVFSSADQVAVARALCHQAIDKAATRKLREGRALLSEQTAAICSAYNVHVLGKPNPIAGNLSICRNLSLLPLLVLGVLKNETFQDAQGVPVDIRSQAAVLLRILPMSSWLHYVHANFYSLHNMPQQAGMVDQATGQCILPPRLHLSGEKLEPHGCYLIENKQMIYIWIGKEAVPPLCKDLLGVANISQVKSGPVAMLPSVDSALSRRVASIIAHLRSSRQTTYYPSILIVREDGDALARARFLSHLLEDRQPTGPTAAGANQAEASSGMSYFQWLGFLRAKCEKQGR
ncbi:COPII subunit [Apophysomyces ossiformis]|uniref:COPII subunit n=1 Tax=Apophysomyces ossiformis TaxID=679940 RepID=A0A8H7BLD8_9FUNG|nr:COPII subunit [Apophysomyces ossiformis]